MNEVRNEVQGSYATRAFVSRGLKGCLILVAALLVSLFLTPNSTGGFVGYVSLETLFTNSTEIACGTLTEVRELGADANGFRRMLAQMDIDWILKGSVDGKTIAIEYAKDRGPGVDSGPVIDLKNGQHLMVFLSRKDGKYSFTNASRPAIRVAPSALNVVRNTKIDFEEFLLFCLKDSDPGAVREAARVLHELGSDKARLQIQGLTKSTDPVICGSALAYCLRSGKGDHLEEALEYLEKIPDTPDTREVKNDLLNRISGLRDVTTLPTLNRLMSSQRVQLRRAAVMALRNIKNEQSVACLIQGLEDDDDTVRYVSAVALNAILGNPEVEGKPLRYTREDYGAILGFWKLWWQTEDAAKFKTAQTSP